MTASFPSLPELQSLLSELIRAPEGVAQGLRDLVERGDLPDTDLSFAVEANAKMTPEERLDVYATMYFVRLHDCLSEDFPKTRSRLGDVCFNNLITDYLLVHPPTHFSLREAGRALPDFLADHALAQRFPAAGDTARLEWARVDVFDDHDATPIDRDRLLEASAAEPDRYAIRFIPAVRLVTVDPSVLEAWGAEIDAEDDGPIDVMVWRKGFQVLHRRAAEDEARCFDILSNQGITLPELAELLLKPDAGAERTSERFAGLLELWLQDELLVDAGS